MAKKKKKLKAQIEIVKHFIDEESLCYTEDTDEKVNFKGIVNIE